MQVLAVTWPSAGQIDFSVCTIRIYFIKYTLFNDNILNYCHFIHFGFRFFAPCVNNVELICWSYIKCLDWGQRSDATAGHSDFINISDSRSAFFVKSWNVNIFFLYLGFFVERIVIHSKTKIIATVVINTYCKIIHLYYVYLSTVPD